MFPIRKLSLFAIFLWVLSPAFSQTPELRLQVSPTVLMVERAGTIHQVFSAVIESSLEVTSPIDVVLSDGTNEWRSPVDLSGARRATVQVTAPRAQKRRGLQAYLAHGAERVTAPQSVAQGLIRDWKLFFQTTPHIDLGYTDLVANVEAHLRSMTLDDVVRLLSSTGSYPPGERLFWTSESSWFFDISAAHPTREVRAALETALERRQLSIGAIDFNLHSEMASSEELVRSLFRARRLARAWPGLDASVAMQSDPPGYTWALPQVLQAAGIPYLAIWANDAHPAAANLPEVFYWETPAGGRVLTAYQPGFAGNRLGNYRLLDPKTGKDLPVEREALLTEIAEHANHVLKDMEDTNYPFDALLMRVVGRDNGLPPEHMAQLARWWNARYVSPRITFSGPGAFFRHIEQNFANRIPTLRGDLNSWWIDGAGTLARATAMARQARFRTPVAEMLAGVNSWAARAADSYPRQAFTDLYGQLLRFDEHTFGLRAYGVRAQVLAQGDDTDAPAWERFRQSWRDKEIWATRASESSRSLLDQAFRNLARQVTVTSRAILIFNPVPRARDGLVRVAWPSRAPAVIDPDTGREVPSQISDGELVFLAAGLPALGYKAYPLKSSEATILAPATALENSFYKITLDSRRSGIRSLIDKESGAELVDSEAPFLFDQILYQDYNGIASQDRHRDTAGTAQPIRSAVFTSDPSRITVRRGKLFDEVSWNAALTGVPGSIPRIEQAVRLYHPIKRIELLNVLRDKKPTAKVEGVYLSLPWKLPGGSWRLENAGVAYQPYENLLAGANPNIFAVGSWVLCKGSNRFVAVSPRDAPLVEFGEVRSLKLDDVASYRPKNSYLYSHLMNNFWGTNFPLWQGGDFTFSYALTSGVSRDPVPAASSLAEPLEGLVVEPHQGQLPPQGAFLELSGASVRVLTIKRSEDGKDWILRCQENAGQSGTLRVRPRLLRFASAQLVNALEDLLAPVSGSDVRVPIRRFEIVTLRLTAPDPSSSR